MVNASQFLSQTYTVLIKHSCQCDLLVDLAIPLCGHFKKQKKFGVYILKPFFLTKQTAFYSNKNEYKKSADDAL